MDVSLSPELEKFINECVDRGRYNSTNEAVNAAVGLLRESESAESRLEELLLEAEESGPAEEMTSAEWAAIEAEGLKRLRTRRPA